MLRWISMLSVASLCACSAGGGSSGGEGGSAGSGGSGGSSTGSTTTVDDRLYPLEVGRTWTYDIQSTYGSCPAGQRTFEVLSAGTATGAFDVRTQCGDEGVYTVSGDVVESQFPSSQGTWLRWLDEPVEEGHSWTTTNGSATFGMIYHQANQVTTPAGTFSDCWQVVQQVSYQQEWVYCRGVGLVSSTVADLGGGGISVQLVAKSF